MKKILTLILTVVVNSLSAQTCVPNTNSLSFDGFSSYVSADPDTAYNLSSAITIEAWIKSTAWGFSAAQNSIVCKHGWSTGEGGYVLRCGGTGELSFNIAGVDTNGTAQSWQDVISPAGVLPLNTWTHVAGTFDGHNLKIYINGVLSNTLAFRGTIASSSDYYLKIGKLADDAQFETRYFSGNIDEVRIWNRALADTEISNNISHHLEYANANGLISYFRMNDGSGTTLTDLGSSPSTTILNGTTWSTDVPFNEGPVAPIITQSGSDLSSNYSYGNQWYRDSVLIPGADAQTFTATQNGNYYVLFTDSSGCYSRSVNTIHITSVGIADLQNDNSSLRYNSSTHELFTNNFSGAICIYSSKGELLINEKVYTNSTIRLNNFAAGIYIVQINSASKISTKRIAVTNE